MSTPKPAKVDSPCTGICQIDAATRLCEGCMRSIDEIASWSTLSPQQRREIMSRLPARKRDESASSAGSRAVKVN